MNTFNPLEAYSELRKTNASLLQQIEKVRQEDVFRTARWHSCDPDYLSNMDGKELYALGETLRMLHLLDAAHAVLSLSKEQVPPEN